MRAIFSNAEVNLVKKMQSNITITFDHIYRTDASGKIICQETNMAGSSCVGPCNFVPSMFLPYVDPPTAPFTIDGKTFGSFVDIIDGKEVESKRNTSDPSKYIPGVTIIHEFGHALGMHHEHQNNLYGNNPIVFNIPVIQKELGWTLEAIKHNITDMFTNKNVYSGSEYDPNSIMKYALPDRWLISGGPLQQNYTLSNADKEELSKKYPSNAPKIPVFNITFLDTRPGEEWKKYWVKKVVLDTFTPWLGIKFIFNNLDTPGKNTPITNVPPCTSSSLGQDLSIPHTDENTIIIICSVVGILFILGILGLVIHYYTRKR